MGLEPATFELEVQRAYTLRHGGYAKITKCIKANHLKIVSISSKHNLQIFFQSNI